MTRDPNLFSKENVSVRVVDYKSIESLFSALTGQDAVISAMSYHAIEQQTNVVIAAAMAGVRRFIPSEYGNNLSNPVLARFPIYQPKLAIRKLCEEMRQEYLLFSWTSIQNASFLGPDWTLDFIIDTSEHEADIKDGGNVVFCAATYVDISKAAMGILDHMERTANRAVSIASIRTTQNETLSLAKNLDPTINWKITHSDTAVREVEAFERWGAGDRSEEVVAMFINRAFIGEKNGGNFPELDNDILGIKMMDQKGLESIISSALAR